MSLPTTAIISASLQSWETERKYADFVKEERLHLFQKKVSPMGIYEINQPGPSFLFWWSYAYIDGLILSTWENIYCSILLSFVEASFKIILGF